MRCLQCNFVGESRHGACPRCGYPSNERVTSGPLHSQAGRLPPSSSVVAPRRALTRGDALRGGRYRLTEPALLPANQQDQGPVWVAADAQSPRHRVLIRQVRFPDGVAPANPQQEVEAMARRWIELAKLHTSLPVVIDVFTEQGLPYIVWYYPEGESLATLLARQGGALPEQQIAEYGRQLCEVLVVLSQQSPALVHGAISPEIIIVSPDKSRVTLIHFPLSPPRQIASSNAPASHLSPEQLRGTILPASDLYSLSATLHHAVTGYDPSERLAFFYPPARRLNPLVTSQMEAILARGVRLTASQRYFSPSEMLKDLQDLLASYPLVTDTPRLLSGPQMPNVALLRQQSRRRSIRTLTITGAISGLAILSFFLVYLIPTLSNSAATASHISAMATADAQQLALARVAYDNQLQTEMQSFQQKGIGISEGRLVFDAYPGRKDSDLKKRAAQAWQQGDTSSAVNLLSQAVNTDPIDGEAQIYNENIHLLQNNAPYITVVLGVPLDGSDLYLETIRDQLQAAYLAQQEVNTQNVLPGGTKLRLIIANSGTNNADVATVAQFIADRVSKDSNLDHIVAVVGWPYSAQTINARDIIASAHIPLVSQTASSVKLSGSSPYFFRINPPDDAQGSTMGTVVVQNLHAKRILEFYDPTDAYSVSLANAFATRVHGLQTVVDQETITLAKTTVDQYQQLLESDLPNNFDQVFLAGYDVDAVRLAHAVGNESRLHPLDANLLHAKVIGGDGFSTGGVIMGQGVNGDADLARAYPQDMRRLIFTAFADASEWAFLGTPPDKQPPFFSEWSRTYQSSALSINAPAPVPESLLIYDAIQTVVQACLQLHTPSGQAVHDALLALGKGNVPAYQGVSGRILFDDKGNPVDKAIVVLEVQDGGNGNVIKILQLAGTFH